jgi:hypothetical protein
MKRCLAALALVVCLIAGCSGSQGVKLRDSSKVTSFCQVEAVGVPMFWAVWTIKPSKAVTIDRVSLTPSRQPKVQIVKELAETRNSGGSAGEPWVGDDISPGGIPKGQTFDGWLGIRSADDLHVRAHEQVTFGFAIKPVQLGITTWKGLDVYYESTSSLIPTSLTLDVRRVVKGNCAAHQRLLPQSDRVPLHGPAVLRAERDRPPDP